MTDQIAKGAELTSFELETGARPPVAVFGWTEPDPLLDEWQEAMNDYRSRVEADQER